MIYSATTLDIRLMEIHLCDMLKKRIDLKYDFLREATTLAAVNDDDLRVDPGGELINKTRLKRKLRPLYWGMYDKTWSAIARRLPDRWHPGGDGDHSPRRQGRLTVSRVPSPSPASRPSRPTRD